MKLSLYCQNNCLKNHYNIQRLLAELVTPATGLTGEGIRLPIKILEGRELVLNIRHLLSHHLGEALHIVVLQEILSVFLGSLVVPDITLEILDC